MRLDNKWKWEKWDAGADQWVPLQEWESPTDINADDATVKYRGKVQWYTTTNPLGHNGRHRLSVVEGNRDAGRVTFAAGYDDVYKVIPSPQGERLANVQNLVVTEVSTNSGSSNYFKFDPDSDDPALTTPIIYFTIQDLGDPHEYNWKIKIRRTGESAWRDFVTGFMPGVGSHTAFINPSDAAVVLPEWGTYAFDIEVEEVEGGRSYDHIPTIRSTHLSMPNPMPGNVLDPDGNPRDGHYVEIVADGDNSKAQIGYYLQDTNNINAKAVQVDFVNPDLEVKVSRSGLPTIVGTPHANIDLYTFTDSDFAGESAGNRWIAVFIAEDSHAKDYRDHTNKPTVALNEGQPRVFHIEDDDMVTNELDVSRYPVGTVLLSYSNTKIVREVFMSTGWLPRAGVPGSGTILYTKIVGSDFGRRTISNGTFDNYNRRHTQCYVHVIGADLSESGDTYGMANGDEQYSYVYTGTIRDRFNPGTAAATVAAGVKKTTIHEIAHQFLSPDADDEHHGGWDNSTPPSGLLCVMDPGFPGPTTDYWFCRRHARMVRGSTWPDQEPEND